MLSYSGSRALIVSPLCKQGSMMMMGPEDKGAGSWSGFWVVISTGDARPFNNSELLNNLTNKQNVRHVMTHYYK